MSRTRDEARVELARVLASRGMSREAIAAQLRVSARTVSRWLGPLAPGRPAVADADASARTRRRRNANSGPLDTVAKT